MCADCASLVAIYHVLAFSSEGKINNLVETLEKVYKDDREVLIRLSVVGAEVCAQLLAGTASAERIIMMRRPKLPEGLTQLGPHVDHMLRVLQTALDAQAEDHRGADTADLYRELVASIRSFMLSHTIHECRLFCAGIAMHYACVYMGGMWVR